MNEYIGVIIVIIGANLGELFLKESKIAYNVGHLIGIITMIVILSI